MSKEIQRKVTMTILVLFFYGTWILGVSLHSIAVYYLAGILALPLLLSYLGPHRHNLFNTGIYFAFFGGALNCFAMTMNGGKMPVIATLPLPFYYIQFDAAIRVPYLCDIISDRFSGAGSIGDLFLLGGFFILLTSRILNRSWEKSHCTTALRRSL